MSGRFAPSPTGDLHIGNLRTAWASWLDAQSRGIDWLVRFEDLDGVVAHRETADRQLASLAALGMSPARDPLWQSEHLKRYETAVQILIDAELTYPCYCSRREIREAVSAPNGPPAGMYPGTCSTLDSFQRRERAESRPAALRFRAGGDEVGFIDLMWGDSSYPVDDFVIRRNDGVPAYNLVVVVDDGFQGITSVVRADDLLSSTSRQILVAQALGLGPFEYSHVPLVVNPAGDRLTKRDGAMTLPQLAELGWSSADVLDWIKASMPTGLAAPSRWSNTWNPDRI